jgi:hypothetical protein
MALVKEEMRDISKVGNILHVAIYKPLAAKKCRK